MKNKFGPEKVKNAVLAVTAAVFAMTFAAVSGENNSTTGEQSDQLTSTAPVAASSQTATENQTSVSLVTDRSIRVIQPPAPTQVATPQQPIQRHVVVPFPKARSRAS